MKRFIKRLTKKSFALFLAVLMVLSSWAVAAPVMAEAAANYDKSSYRKADKYGTPYWDGSDVYSSKWNSGTSNTVIKWPKHIYMDISETLQSAGYYFDVQWEYGNGTDYRIVNNGFIFGGWKMENASNWPANYNTMNNMFTSYDLDASLPNGSGTQETSFSNTSGDLYVGLSNWDGANTIIFRTRKSGTNQAYVFMKGTPKSTGEGLYSTSGSKPSSFGGWQSWSCDKWKDASDKYTSSNDSGNWTTDCYDGEWKEVKWNITIYDKSSLSAAIKSAESTYTNSSNYTTASWNAYQTSLAAAKAALTKRATTQAEIDNALKDFNAATKPSARRTFTVTWQNVKGEPVGTVSVQEESSVNITELSKNYKNSIVAEANGHKIYTWNLTNYSGNVTPTGDIVITEKDGALESHTGYDWVAGDTEHTRKCSLCGWDESGSHDGNWVFSKALTESTCTQEGTNEEKCSICGKTRVVSNGELKPHDFTGDWVYVDENSHSRKCKICSAIGLDGVVGATASHGWIDKETIKEATCVESGSKIVYCGQCKVEKTVEIPATGIHAEYDYVTVDPTCTADGYTKLVCKVCKFESPDTIPGEPALGHDFSSGKYLENVTGPDGNHYQKCIRCDVYGWGTEEGACENHKWDEGVVTKDPTCTADGVRRFTCTVCSATYEAAESKKGHAYTSVVTDPTCTAQGYTTHTCGNCGDTYKDSYVDALGHDFTGDYVKVKDGIDGTHNRKCSRYEDCKTCGLDKEANKTEAHRWCDEADVRVITAATCNTNGVKEYYCLDCNDATYRDVIKSTGDHVYVAKVIKEPTCTETGIREYRCGCTDLQKTETIDALGHDFTGDCEVVVSGKGGTHKFKCTRFDDCKTYSEPVEHTFDNGVVTKKPTCTDTGVMTYTCDACKDSYTEVIEATGHNFTGEIKNDADGAEGTHSWKCKNENCDVYGHKDAYGNHVVGGTAHVWGNATITKDPKCNEKGSKYSTCTLCGATKTEDIDYDRTHVVKTEAYDRSMYCGQRGYYAFWHCTKCGKYFSDEDLKVELTSGEFTEIKGVMVPDECLAPITAHDFTGDLVVVESGKNGTHAVACVNYATCKAVSENAVSHNWDKDNDGDVDTDDAVKTERTHIKDGAYTYSCACGDSYFDKIKADELHTYERTPDEDGYVYAYFDEYDDIIKENPEDRDGKVSYESTFDVTPETCLVPGYTTYNCPCGEFDIVYDEDFEPKHPNGGVTGNTDGTVTVEPTCTEKGEKVIECTCGVNVIVEIDALGHKFDGDDEGEEDDIVDAVAATCTANGSDAYKQCLTCNLYFAADAEKNSTDGKEDVNSFEIPKLKHSFIAGGDQNIPDVCEDKETCGHEFHDAVATPATCKEAATYYISCDFCGVKVAEEYTYSYGDPIDHVFEGEIRANADDTHSYACTYGCGEYDATVACEYKIYTEVDEAQHNVACVCGNNKNEDHVYEGYTTNLDGSRVYACTKCEYTETTYCNYELERETPATCEMDGFKLYRCTDEGCNKTMTETVPATGHAWVSGNETFLKSAATCTADAVYYEYCTNCKISAEGKTNATWTKEGSKLVHTWGDWAPVEGELKHARTCSYGTCTETEDCYNNTDAATCVDEVKCSVCSTVIAGVNAENHKSVTTVPEVPATCQKVGKTAYKYCEACRTNVTTAEDIAVLGHVYSAWTRDEGAETHSRYCTTCKAEDGTVASETGVACSGGTAYCNAKAICTDCKETYGDFAADNHSTEANHLDESTVKEATCQTKGNTGDTVYDCCGAVKTAGQDTELKEHDFSVEVSRVPGNCTTEGSVTYKCSTCDPDVAKVKTKTDKLDKNPKVHASEVTKTVNDVAATCTTDGYTGDVYYTCCYDETEGADNRRALKSSGTVIKANGEHAYSAPVPEYMLDKDENGKAVVLVEKDDEGNVVSRSLKVLAVEPSYSAKVAARHADKKWYHAEICSVCSEIKYTACAQEAHKYNCTDTDLCAVCNGLCSIVDASKHKNIVEVEGTEAVSCTVPGVADHYKCEGCKKEFIDAAGKTELQTGDDGKYTYAEIAVTKAHDFDTDAEPVDGTGENEGKKVYRCKNYKTEANPNGCTAEQVVEDGDDVVNPPVVGCDHEWSTDYKVKTEATCTKQGAEYIYCTKCGEFDKETKRLIPVTEHPYGDWAPVEGKEPSCEVDGEKARICSVCGNVETETVKATGHAWSTWVVTDATCQNNGSKVRTCGNCNETETIVISANGAHVPDEDTEEVKKVATCTEKGLSVYSCSECGQKFERETATNDNHNLVIVPGKAPTCSTYGYSESEVCSRCGYVSVAAVPGDELAKDAHIDKDGDGYCDECGYDKYQGQCDCICHKQNGFMKFIYKILRFFWKLFGISYSCRCGATHY